MSTPPRPSSRQFQIDLELAAAPEAVWQAVSEAREIARWFPPEAEVTPGVGGRMVWAWGAEHRWPLEIEVWEPPRHLRARYESQIDDGRGGKVPLYVDFHVEGRGGKTVLRLVHSGFGPEASFDAEYNGISRGWPVELASLRHYLERHLGQERLVAWSVAKPSSSPDAAWQALCKALGNLEGARVGERLALRFGPDALLETTVLRTGRHELAANVASVGDGFFRIAVESCMGELQVWLWLALWGRPGAERDRFQRAFDAVAERMSAAKKVEARA